MELGVAEARPEGWLLALYAKLAELRRRRGGPAVVTAVVGGDGAPAVASAELDADGKMWFAVDAGASRLALAEVKDGKVEWVVVSYWWLVMEAVKTLYRIAEDWVYHLEERGG